MERIRCSGLLLPRLQQGTAKYLGELRPFDFDDSGYRDLARFRLRWSAASLPTPRARTACPE